MSLLAVLIASFLVSDFAAAADSKLSALSVSEACFHSFPKLFLPLFFPFLAFIISESFLTFIMTVSHREEQS